MTQVQDRFLSMPLRRYVLFQREVICRAMRAQGYLSNHALNRFREWKPGVAAFCTWIGHSWAVNKQRDCLSAPNRGTRWRYEYAASFPPTFVGQS
jgi:hypothetical protein